MDIRDRISKAFTVIMTVVYVVLAVLYLAVLAYTVKVDLYNFYLYYSFIGGAATFFLFMLFPRFRHNMQWWMKFTHELTHTLMALVFFRKISTFVVRNRECYVAYSGGWFGYVPITLSPYCVPIYTLMLLPFRYMGDGQFMPVFDALLGFTCMFHFFSFCSQFNFKQSDIVNCGMARSVSFIAFLQFFNVSLVIATIRGGVLNALERVCMEYPVDVLQFICRLMKTYAAFCGIAI